MRDPNRLDGFYDHLKTIHKTYLPDQRFCQFIMNFFGWVVDNYQRDPFFYEEDKTEIMLDSYIDYLTESGDYSPNG